MGKGMLTPFYVGVVWALTISYQLFTQTAVSTVITAIVAFWPSAATQWLYNRMETIAFIHAFAWIYVLSSVIPGLLLKKRSVLVQFLVCLTLTLIPMWVKDILHLFTGSQLVDQIFTLSGLFLNPLFASIFIVLPYLVMISLDLKQVW